MIRVLIADDDPDVRASLQTILSSAADIDVAVAVAVEAADGAAAVTVAATQAPDVVLLDIRMPMMDGLAAAHQIRRQRPRQLIIMLTTFGEADYVRQAVAPVVNGFLLKAGDPHALLDGIRSVVAGGACLSPPIAAMLIEDHQLLATTRQDADRAHGPRPTARPRTPGPRPRRRRPLQRRDRRRPAPERSHRQGLPQLHVHPPRRPQPRRSRDPVMAGSLRARPPWARRARQTRV